MITIYIYWLKSWSFYFLNTLIDYRIPDLPLDMSLTSLRRRQLMQSLQLNLKVPRFRENRPTKLEDSELT